LHFPNVTLKRKGGAILFYSQFFSLNLKVKLFIGITTMSYTKKI